MPLVHHQALEINRMKPYSILIILIALSGCSSVPIAPTVATLPPAPEIPLPNEANVRLPEHVKAYAVNRYIDPANRRILHERHVLYRLENDADWRMRANANQQIIVGNTMSSSKLELQPIPLTKELASELTTQKRMRSQMEETQKKMMVAAEAMSGAATKLRGAVEEQNNAIEELKQRVEMLETSDPTKLKSNDDLLDQNGKLKP